MSGNPDVTPDITVTVGFDFMYDIIKTTEEHSYVESPPWASQPGRWVDGIVDGGKIFGKVSGALISGNIRVSPVSATPTVIGLLKLFAGGSL